MYRRFYKRLLDVAISLISLVVLSPLLLIISIFVRISLGSPVIFKQERIGKDERPFTLLKFRSMKNGVDKYGVPLPDEERLTKLGRIIRKLSLDELPSLINILKGEMSIVGPRPLPTNYLPWFTDNERLRHQVRGGLTGLAQVNGRNTSSWEDRFRYDIEYVENCSFKMDLQVVIKTVRVVLEHKDVGARGVDAPPDFHVYRSGLSEQELKQMEERKNASKETIDA